MNNHNEKFYQVQYFYSSGYWTESQVMNAVNNPPSNPWISQDECDEILNNRIM